MDPEAAFSNLIDLYGEEDPNPEAIRDQADDLLAWLHGGGFVPFGLNRESLIRYLRRISDEAQLAILMAPDDEEDEDKAHD